MVVRLTNEHPVKIERDTFDTFKSKYRKNASPHAHTNDQTSDQNESNCCWMHFVDFHTFVFRLFGSEECSFPSLLCFLYRSISHSLFRSAFQYFGDLSMLVDEWLLVYIITTLVLLLNMCVRNGRAARIYLIIFTLFGCFEFFLYQNALMVDGQFLTDTHTQMGKDEHPNKSKIHE